MKMANWFFFRSFSFYCIWHLFLFPILQSIQAMDEEKNKLDAFCEQSLKNVSIYTIHNIFGLNPFYSHL
jgi:hypothetical protein